MFSPRYQIKARFEPQNLWKALLVLIFGVNLFLENAQGDAKPTFRVGLGAYIWTGQLNGTQRLARSSNHVLKSGLRSARILVSPRTAQTYGWAADPCINQDANYLSCLVQKPEVAAVLAHPDLKSLGLTVYDSKSAGDTGYATEFLNQEFQTQNASRIQREYERLAITLLERYGTRPLTIWISSWEGDNQVYCEKSYAYATDLQERLACQEQYRLGQINPQVKTVEASLKGLAEWHRNRMLGIANGRKKFTDRKGSATQLQLLVAPEINSTRFLRVNGHRDLLTELIAQKVPFHALSYSAYEATNLEFQQPGSIASHIHEISVRLLKGFGEGTPRGVIVGEYGFSQSQYENAPQRLARSTVALKQLYENQQILGAILWQAFDDEALPTFGLFARDGTKTKLGQAIFPHTWSY